MKLKKIRATAHAVCLCIMSAGVTACATESKALKPMPGSVAVPVDQDLKKYYDRSPAKITQKDLKILKNINRLAYDLTEEEEKDIRVDLIYNFIITHKAHREEWDKLKVTTTIDVGSRTRNPYSQSYNYNPIESKQFYSAYVELTYPIWDDKTEMRIHNDRLKYNLSLIDRIREYADAYNMMLQYSNEVKFLRLKQRVWKGEELTGVKYRDEWLTLLDSLRMAKTNLRKARATVRALRVYLLNLTTDPKGLMKLL